VQKAYRIYDDETKEFLGSGMRSLYAKGRSIWLSRQAANAALRYIKDDFQDARIVEYILIPTEGASQDEAASAADAINEGGFGEDILRHFARIVLYGVDGAGGCPLCQG
jgi:hypothetical protein